MATEEMLEVVESQDNSQPQVHDENEYSIYNYLKEHTAFLVACVSAFVAVISFLLNYAASQYTGAFLRYWMVDTAYAKENKTELVYVILFTLLYTVVMIISHKVMSGTANAFSFYNKIISTIRWYYKDAKKEFRALKRRMRKLSKEYKRLAKATNSPKGSDLYQKAEQKSEDEDDMEHSLKALKAMKRKCEIWLSFMVVGSCLIMFGLVYLFAGLMASSNGDPRALGPIILASMVVVIDLVFYIVPAYCSSRVKKGKYKEISLDDLEKEMEHADNHRFPIVAVAHIKAKELLTNKKIKQIVIIAIVILLAFVGSYSSAGKADAEKLQAFPVYADETGTYAVVYNNGESLVLKKANIEDTQIEINVQQQKVIPSSDVFYEILKFETVIVTGKDGEK